jgi:ketosteroid isomerase-like protein
MAAQHAVDEASIRGRIGQLAEAVRAADVDGVESIYAPDIVSFDVQPPLQHVGLEAKSKNWVDVFTMYRRPLNCEIRDLSITVDGDLAFARSFNRISGTLKNGTTSGGFWVRATYCLRKIDGNWLVAHDHVSVPLDPETGSAVLDIEPPAAEGR